MDLLKKLNSGGMKPGLVNMTRFIQALDLFPFSDTQVYFKMLLRDEHSHCIPLHFR